ncbi:MAG: endonuclease/exonuclease/phosphatase family protein [Gemmatimonadota bacterium]|nr:endonuclease/exonuclease/phosphatase family protein [Gemmatimonadota bacterium]
MLQGVLYTPPLGIVFALLLTGCAPGGRFSRPAVKVRIRPAVLLWALAAIVLGCASLPPGGAPPPIRMLVYNIHAGKDGAGADNLPRVAEEMRRSQADVVLLQEVDRGTERSGRVDQMSVLSRLTGFHGAFGKTLDYQGGEYGIAILSRWPISSDTLIRLPVQPLQQRAGGSYEPRGVLHARVAAPGGALDVLNTHLDPSREDHYRLQEVAHVRTMAHRLRTANPRVVVGGDFNAEPGSAVIASMTADGWQDAWTSCGVGEGLSYPGDAPIKRIDYLFLAPTLACHSAAVLETRASDHRPVLVVLREG